MKTNERIPNRLIDEKSPYLLQHAYNPVNWFPWCEEAFDKAKTENKPIFFSCGYSTCHWCHVMERESFEDEEVASLLNKNFIAIKVDKEERPDIDTIYMGVCQALTGQGGWPLTILMTPQQKPFFAGTYFPKNSRYNMTGLMELLEAVSIQWKENANELISSGNDIVKQIKKLEFSDDNLRKITITKEIAHLAKKQFEQSFDSTYGGFHHAPKFPTPHNLMFLLRYGYYEQDKNVIKMVEKTLQQMYKGGIFDHIGYGFSRYSTDEKWLAPHFEKMLYDNALLTMIYLETYQFTKNELYKNVAIKVLDYVERELTDTEGGFYCAQDADSEGVEGKYYVFTPDEIIKLLGEEDGNYFNDYFDITTKGNFEGKSIPNLIRYKKLEIGNQRIENLSNKVYQYRLNRTKLHKDDKILTSWNSLMISTYAKAYAVIGDEKYLRIAEKSVGFIKDKLSLENNRLKVRYRDGDSYGIGHIDDYAFYIWALLEMYESTFQVEYLKEALGYCKSMIAFFFDEKQGGFFLYAKDAEQLLFRPKEVYDGAIPSGNSVAAYVLVRLAKITGESKLEELASLQLNFIAGNISEYPYNYSFSLIAILFALYPSKEIVIVVEDKKSYKEIQKLKRDYFTPNVAITLKDTANEGTLGEIAEFTKDYELKNNETTIYVCENQACLAPFHDINKLVDNFIFPPRSQHS